MAVLNASHPFAEATAALGATGEQVPPLVTDAIERLGDAVLARARTRRGSAPGSEARRAGAGRPPLPLIPPQWSPSPGALALRDGMMSLDRVLWGDWPPPPRLPPATAADSPACARGCAGGWCGIGEQLGGGRIAWEYTVRLMLCTGVAAVADRGAAARSGPTGWC